MKRNQPISLVLFIFTIISLNVNCNSEQGKNQEITKKDVFQLLIGTYTPAGTQPAGLETGIYLLELDRTSGKLTATGQVDGGTNPSFLAIHPNNQFFYAVNEKAGPSDLRLGSVRAYSVDSLGNMKFLNEVSSLGNGPCHLSVTQDGQHLAVAHYSSGNVSLFSIENEGKLSEGLHEVQHTGGGPTTRQKGAHAHMVYSHPGKNMIYAIDLGTDKIYAYNIKADSLHKLQEIIVSPGAGPRHMDLDADARFAYVVGELNGTVEVFKLPEWKRIQVIPTLINEESGPANCADIHISPGGKFLYITNRGEYNSLTIYRRDPLNGKLTWIDKQSTYGKTPRNFMITPDGKFLVCANQNSDNLIVFIIDQNTGKLTKVDEFMVPRPVCIKVWPVI